MTNKLDYAKGAVPELSLNDPIAKLRLDCMLSSALTQEIISRRRKAHDANLSLYLNHSERCGLHASPFRPVAKIISRMICAADV